MKNKLQKIIKHIKTMFYNLSLCVSLRKDTAKNIEYKEKNSKFGIILIFIMEKIYKVVKHILGVEEWKTSNEIICELKKTYQDYNFNEKETILLEDDKNIRVWLIFSNVEIFLVSDNGFKTDIILNRKKELFNYHFIHDDGRTKIYIEDTTIPIPINISTSGGTEQISYKIDKNKKL